ncbi:septum formation initiator family protein [Thioalkalivibrio sp. HK1]|uniref:septum formation initiator family protein n=1 Tax=Thioalkalivibrio sp. HK1 TaxID=1469245 RepID=UPI00047125A0|nr:septum formation initiator family protein [Thioalkalivibrio sp. HK1]
MSMFLFRTIIVALLALTGALQYRLWVADDGMRELHRLELALAQGEEENDRLDERNRRLSVEVHELKEGSDAVEERARHDFGMIRRGEIFYRIVDE